MSDETRDESDYFEQLLAPLDTLGQTNVANFSGEGFSNSHSQGQEQPGIVLLPSPQTSVMWEAVLASLEEQFRALDKDPVEAQIELPNLGQIAVRIVQRGDALEVALRFNQDDAWQHCTAHQLTSTAWLSQQLGCPVRLTLLHEVH
ncbi:type III secretion system HrpP C-terminal domain-containing protein [Pseudomonas sp. 22526]|uniref:type III secretion system HrpP C-terminal domain-containing protein n=1 Tax=Pseudomonas sp. 22526 TaxID=3453937 RepID=UPI003F85011A